MNELRSSAKAAILDTNLLLLLLTAEVDPALLLTYKRVTMFVQEDVLLLAELLKQFDVSFTTNSVLTEVSNLVQNAPTHRRPMIMSKLSKYAANITELRIPSADIVKLDTFFQLGITDAGLTKVADTYTVITTDFHLAGRITAAGNRSINFNHLRSNRMLSPHY